MSSNLSPFPIASFLQLAQREIFIEFGHTTRIGRQSAVQFGRNPDMPLLGEEMIWSYGGNETLLSANTINTVSSADAAATQNVLISGHTFGADGFTFVQQMVTLNGQSKVTLETPLARAQFARCMSPEGLADDVFIYEDSAITNGIPDDSTKVHNFIEGGINQASKAMLTIPKGAYFVLTRLWAFAERSASGTANINYRVKPFNGCETVAGSGAVNTGAGFELDLTPFVVIPPNTDLWLTGIAGTNNMDIAGGLMGFYAEIVENNATLTSEGYIIQD